MLCRTENYANSHSGFDSFLRGQRILSVLGQLAGEDMLLFKEKINYKLAGSGQSQSFDTLITNVLIDCQVASTLTSTPTHTRTSR